MLVELHINEEEMKLLLRDQLEKFLNCRELSSECVSFEIKSVQSVDCINKFRIQILIERNS